MRPPVPQAVRRAALLTPLLTPLLPTLLATWSAPAAAAADPEIAALRAQLNQLKTQYERRIANLEARLAASERRTAATETPAPARPGAAAAPGQPMTAPAAPGAPAAPAHGSVLGALTSGSAFNPQIAVFLDGNYYHDDIGGEGSTLVGAAYQPSRPGGESHDHDHGHAHAASGLADAGHAHGAAANGFNFREAELSFTATVDPYFDAALFLAVDGDGSVELEEGWFQTRALPYGLRMKGGKFLSDFGYINRQHPHQWDFVDQNLPYLNIFGAHGLQDTGVQLTWVPKLPFYALLGAELAQGDQERFGALAGEDARALLEDNAGTLDTANDGPRLWTAFLKVAPDLPARHALQVGVSYARNNQHQEVHGHTHEVQVEGTDETVLVQHYNALAGDAEAWGADLVYKYTGGGAQGRGDFRFQSEYLRSVKDLSIHSSPHAEVLGSSRTFTSDGLYAQAVYGFAPRWTVGLRYDVFGMVNQLSTPTLDQDFGSSSRWTLDLTWNLSEFSRLRAQYAWNDILVEPGERSNFDAFYLQFVMSMGTHGAHTF